jgi:hypothetical protein
VNSNKKTLTSKAVTSLNQNAENPQQHLTEKPYATRLVSLPFQQ